MILLLTGVEKAAPVWVWGLEFGVIATLKQLQTPSAISGTNSKPSLSLGYASEWFYVHKECDYNLITGGGIYTVFFLYVMK